MKKSLLALRFSIAPAALMAALILPAPALADEFDSLLQQLSTAVQDQKKFEADVPQKLNDSLSLKKENEAKYAELDKQMTSVNAEGSALDAERPGIDALCHGTYPQDQLAAAQARCDAAMGPYNARIEAYNQKLGDVKSKIADVDAQEEKRVEAAKALQAQYDTLKNHVEMLQKVVTAAARARCMANAAAPSDEAAAHAQSVCFDGARAQIAATVGETPPKPTWSATPGSHRTPEQAIQDYKNSGPAQPSTRMRKTAPPPPPPSGN
jgi:peptidoglycan hydrolase CwlO-like protein